MRARFAYISSLGTTAILVAAALLMLAVVGAIVAFHGWPGTADGQTVDSVPLAPLSAGAAALKTTPPIRRVVRSQPARAPRPAARPRRARSTAGLVKDASGSGPDVVPGLVMVPAEPIATTPPPVVPQQPTIQALGSPGPVNGPLDPAPRDPGSPPLDPTGLLPVPLPDPGLPQPTSLGEAVPVPGPLQAMVGEVLSGGPPPTSVDVGGAHVQVPLGIGR